MSIVIYLLPITISFFAQLGSLLLRISDTIKHDIFKRTKDHYENKKGESFVIYAYEMPVNFPITHTVGEGESLKEIARMYNVTTADILHYNKWLHKRRLRVGQKITIAKKP